VSSENPFGADNQQERLWYCGWIVGFVDGEGCFSCPIFRNRKTTLRWQVQPTFVVVQSASSRDVLEDLARFFGCGKVYVNRRHDNHREDIYRYCVTRFADLRGVIVPFFQEHQLRTSKSEKLREVHDGASSHGGAQAPHGFRLDSNSRDHGDDESSQAIQGPENPQRPNADHLTGHIGSPCEMKLWSGPYGDVGRSAETTGPLIT
jgi:hypothetical protein